MSRKILFLAILFLPQIVWAQEKHKGIDWIAFPTIEGNSDSGIAFGGQVSIIDYGEEVLPFVWELRANFTYSTTHRQQHRVIFDAPKLFETWHLYTQLEFKKIDDANWFGKTQVLNSKEHYQYELIEPSMEIFLSQENTVGLFWGGGLKARLSFTKFDERSLLEKDAPLGFDGDRNIVGIVSAGINRTDQPFTPRKGIHFEGYLKGTASPLSRHTWAGFGAQLSSYFSFIDPLVFAQRFMFESLHGKVPMSAKSRIGGIRTFRGIGGVFSQRGFAENRFAGSTKLLSNSEIRYYFAPFYEHYKMGVVAFSDVSKIVGVGNLHPSYGGGVNITWKDAFFFRFDYGRSKEGSDFYIEGRHMF